MRERSYGSEVESVCEKAELCLLTAAPRWEDPKFREGCLCDMTVGR